jgi:very-short-patch-repair endonuclease
MTLQQLLRFYLACIEAEDSRASRKKLDALHHSVISPWDNEEVLFSQAAGSVDFETSIVSERNLLARGPAIAGEPERFFYGYPLLLYSEQSDWYISPLFVQEVGVLEKENGLYTVQPVDIEDIQVNRQLFQRLHVQPEELTSIIQELEASFDSFAARLDAACQLMAVPVPSLNPDALDPWPRPPLADNKWVNRPILFKSEQSPYTFHLKRELELLAADTAFEARARSTALGAFLAIQDGTAPADGVRTPLLQVMPLNRSQEEAARSALTETVTVVTGPPGTGKSQVVVDLLASCAAAGKSVLFASKNNKAVDVVRERMSRLLGESQDWVLRLGNRQMMDTCRLEMDGRLASVNALAVELPPSPRTLQELDSRITGLRTQLERLVTLQEELRALDRDRRVLESLVTPEWISACAGLKIDPPSLDLWTRCQLECALLADRRYRSLLPWLRRSLFRKTTARKHVRTLASSTSTLAARVHQDLPLAAEAGPAVFEELADAFDRLARLARWRHATERVDSKVAELIGLPTSQSLTSQQDEQLSRRSELCALQFRTVWASRLRTSATHPKLTQYFDLADRAFRSKSEQWAAQTTSQWARQVQTLGRELPVWIVTSLSARRALPLSPGLFDLLIIDEASQCDIPSAFPLLYRAKRVLVIGDPNQLRHISTLPTDDEMALASEHNLLDVVSRWSYNNRSLYGLSEDVVSRLGKQVWFLAEHYRSHPEIIEFSNRSFYQGRLILRTDLPRLQARTPGHEMGVFWLDTPGAVPPSPRSAFNGAEIAGVVELIGRWITAGLIDKDDLRLGVVTPFRLQMEKVRDAISRQAWPDSVKARITVGTAHRFQGDECDIMIFSPVVAKGMSERLVRWVATTDQLLNVAITRARSALHVIGDVSACLAAGGSLGDFAASVQEGIRVATETQVTETPPEQVVADILIEMGIWHANQYQVGGRRLDFLVVSPQGIRYDLEVDGRGHLTDEAIRADERRDAEIKSLGFKVIRIDARLIFSSPSTVKEILLRMC